MCFHFFSVIFTDKLGAIFCEFRYIYNAREFSSGELRFNLRRLQRISRGRERETHEDDDDAGAPVIGDD